MAKSSGVPDGIGEGEMYVWFLLVRHVSTMVEDTEAISMQPSYRGTEVQS
jgi:hypothetical protein